jgi:hypothetical protein
MMSDNRLAIEVDVFVPIATRVFADTTCNTIFNSKASVMVLRAPSPIPVPSASVIRVALEYIAAMHEIFLTTYHLRI